MNTKKEQEESALKSTSLLMTSYNADTSLCFHDR